MLDLINQLKKEHAEIKDSLKKIEQMDLYRKEARNELMKVKGLFLQHLKKEDEEVYPKLKMASSNDEDLMHMLNYFEDDAKLISKFTSIFFDRHFNKHSSEGFQMEFRVICSTLLNRIEIEEEIFFPEYDKLFR
ncbi:MAG: hemerythrin domain-containing protein [Nitrospiraceae bacterium]|nr:MAG: hemerythrin domain-containing protein [Nitrospiraceae bacterium]